MGPTPKTDLRQGRPAGAWRCVSPHHTFLRPPYIVYRGLSLRRTILQEFSHGCYLTFLTASLSCRPGAASGLTMHSYGHHMSPTAPCSLCASVRPLEQGQEHLPAVLHQPRGSPRGHSLRERVRGSSLSWLESQALLLLLLLFLTYPLTDPMPVLRPASTRCASATTWAPTPSTT